MIDFFLKKDGLIARRKGKQAVNENFAMINQHCLGKTTYPAFSLSSKTWPVYYNSL